MAAKKAEEKEAAAEAAEETKVDVSAAVRAVNQFLKEEAKRLGAELDYGPYKSEDVQKAHERADGHYVVVTTDFRKFVVPK